MKKLMNKKRNNKGFSLVELIVVVLIIAIIAVALAPQVMKWVGTARTSTDANNAGTIKSAALVGVGEFQANRSGAPSMVATDLSSLPTPPVASPTTVADYIANSIGSDRPRTQANGQFSITVASGGAVSVSWTDTDGHLQSK
jgi:prepilin-type N-terminal cleavage/methylation domain-containing protein